MAGHWTLGLGVTGLYFEELRHKDGEHWNVKSRFQVYCIDFKFKLVYLKRKKNIYKLEHMKYICVKIINH
jgi:hypothetical protein